MEQVLEEAGALRRGCFGDAEVIICSAAATTDILSRMLAVNPDLFGDNEPLTDGQTVPAALPKTKRGLPQ
ncbi:hypothetical protein D3C73_1297770 [compost metagenome]